MTRWGLLYIWQCRKWAGDHLFAYEHDADAMNAVIAYALMQGDDAYAVFMYLVRLTAALADLDEADRVTTMIAAAQ